MDKNLFPYDLAIAAIFKDEAPYLREWLDYHLLAGVEHFYLYNNESSDGYAEVLKPYVDANIVTLLDWPGKVMQMPAYCDALERFRFLCRYMTFIDLDEFIFPKTGQSIVEVADEILLHDETAAALGINQQIFGSNGHERADLSRGVLERFTRRAPSDWVAVQHDDGIAVVHGNIYAKSIVNPRRVNYFTDPHLARCLNGFNSINGKGEKIIREENSPVNFDKIVVNHYFTKSLEEFAFKINRGDACFVDNPKDMKRFTLNDRNEVFDDGILHYRAARAKNFSLPDAAQKFQRMEKFLVETLTAQSPFNAPPEFFNDKLETFLICRAVAEVFGTRIGNRSAEEYALVWIYQLLLRSAKITYAELQLFNNELPALLKRPSPLTKKILQVTCDKILPTFSDILKERELWIERFELVSLQKFLKILR